MVKCLGFFSNILLWTLISFLLLGCTGNPKGKDRTMVLATYAYSNNDRVDNLKPLSMVLEKALERPVYVKSYPNVDAFIQGINSNQVDIGFINTLGYLLLSRENMDMTPLMTLKVKDDASDNYKTVLLANNERLTDVNKLKEHAEKSTMTFVAKGSTSGNLVPRLFLSSIGITSPEEDFKEVSYGGNHTSTFNKLKSGETDICAIGSNEYYLQLGKDTTLLESIKVLWRSEEIPLGPVMVKNTISNSDSAKIKKLLTNLHSTHPKVFNAIKDGWSEARQADRFHPISDAYYDDFRKVDGSETKLSIVLDLF